VLNPTRLASISSKERSQLPDLIQYEIGLLVKSGFQRFEIDEASAPPDVLDVLQELMQEIIQRKLDERSR